MLLNEENKSKIRLMFRVNATKTVHAFNVRLVILLYQTTNPNKTEQNKTKGAGRCGKRNEKR